jgi:hypothetical protein
MIWRTLSSGLLAALALFLGTASRAQEQVTSPRGLQLAWSLEGAWTGVVSDERSGAIYAVGRLGRGVEVDLAGKKTREIRFPGGVGWTLRTAR